MAQDASYTYQPIILLGAGRSGTKIVRDVLGTHPQINVVPFDVNYIWRIGQSQQKDDHLTPQDLKERNKKVILNQFGRFVQTAPILLEKTVSNCLRIPYILEVFPNAKFIHLTRDGRDVTESVARQWGEVREISYIFKKLKTFPVRYAFSYLWNYGINWIKFGLTKKGQDDYIWGVRYPGYKKDLQNLTILEVCATQWKVCVDKCLEDLASLAPERQLHIKYEEITQHPKSVIAQIADFIKVEASQIDFSRLNTRNIGKYKTAFTEAQLNSILPILQPGLTKLNYLA